MTWTVALDPAAVISGRTELSLNGGGITVDQKGIDWGDAQIEAFKATQKWGENTVAYRVPNRTVTIPLFLGGSALALGVEEEVRGKLRQKVGLLQREGGVLLRQRVGGSALYADVMSASLVLPDVWGETGEVEPGVVLVLECLPDFYGEEITLDAVEGTGQIVSVLKQAGVQAVIGGDYPARARIVLTEKGKQNQRSLLWAVDSRHYSAEPTAALYFDAHLATLINGAVSKAKAGTFSGEWAELKEPEKSTWHPFLTTDIASSKLPLTHVGSFKVWARVQAGESGMRLRLSWSLDDATTPTINAPVTIPAKEAFYMVDLGNIRLDEPPVGEHWWRGILQANTGSVAHWVAVDRVWLQPLDDGAGELRATGEPTSSVLERSAAPGTGANEAAYHAGKAWATPGPTSSTVALNMTESSEGLALTKCGFSIASGLSVVGIRVTPTLSERILKVVGEGSVTPHFHYALIDPGVGLSAERESGSFASVGGPNDLWGETWTPAKINEASFGVAFWISQAGTAIEMQYALERLQLTVFLNVGGTTVPVDAVLYSERQSEVRWEGAFREDTTTASYTGISEVSGDLVRLPPSGLEGKPVALFVKNSRGLLPGVDGLPVETDAGIDAIKAQVYYRPCHLGRI